MTPANLAGMLKLAGMELAALTDHNTTRNCPAFFRACEAYGIIPVAGMELTTAEEIHLVCLFATLDEASAFENEVQKARLPIRNRTDLFGRQLIMNENDEVLGEEEHLLSAATKLSIDAAFELVEKHGGACYPAHIDRESGGIIAILGTVPESPAFQAVEFRDLKNVQHYRKNHQFPHLVISSSDAHFLTGIPDADARIVLDGETDEEIRLNLIHLLNGKKA